MPSKREEHKKYLSETKQMHQECQRIINEKNVIGNNSTSVFLKDERTQLLGRLKQLQTEKAELSTWVAKVFFWMYYRQAGELLETSQKLMDEVTSGSTQRKSRLFELELLKRCETVSLRPMEKKDTNIVVKATQTLIASGGFANIYMGYQEQASETGVKTTRVAIKTLKNWSDIANNPDYYKQKFRMEEKVAIRLNHHNIVPCFGAFTNIDTMDISLVTEYMPDGLAMNWLKRQENRSSVNAEQIFAGLLDGMVYMHHETKDKDIKVTHGDLKGNNILVKVTVVDGRLTPITKITDFGLSSFIATNSAEFYLHSLVTGAHRWQAPELVCLERRDQKEERRPLLEKGDIWSFGLTANEVSPFPSCALDIVSI